MAHEGEFKSTREVAPEAGAGPKVLLGRSRQTRLHQSTRKEIVQGLGSSAQKLKDTISQLENVVESERSRMQSTLRQLEQTLTEASDESELKEEELMILEESLQQLQRDNEAKLQLARSRAEGSRVRRLGASGSRGGGDGITGGHVARRSGNASCLDGIAEGDEDDEEEEDAEGDGSGDGSGDRPLNVDDRRGSAVAELARLVNAETESLMGNFAALLDELAQAEAAAGESRPGDAAGLASPAEAASPLIAAHERTAPGGRNTRARPAPHSQPQEPDPELSPPAAPYMATPLAAYKGSQLESSPQLSATPTLPLQEASSPMVPLGHQQGLSPQHQQPTASGSSPQALSPQPTASGSSPYPAQHSQQALQQQQQQQQQAQPHQQQPRAFAKSQPRASVGWKQGTPTPASAGHQAVAKAPQVMAKAAQPTVGGRRMAPTGMYPNPVSQRGHMSRSPPPVCQQVAPNVAKAQALGGVSSGGVGGRAGSRPSGARSPGPVLQPRVQQPQQPNMQDPAQLPNGSGQ